MIKIDYDFRKGYSLEQKDFKIDYLTKKELLEYINLLNSKCSYISISQIRR